MSPFQSHRLLQDNRSPAQYGVINEDSCDVEGRTPLQMAVRCGNAQAVKKLVDLGADVSLVKADKKDAIELERLQDETESVE